jgi:soluble lytic murein transglycosylase-like protein
VGAAAPLALGGVGGGGGPQAVEGTVQEAGIGPSLLGHPVSRRSVEQEVGQRWAGASARARSDLVQQAMRTYGISRNLAEQIYDTAVAHRLDPKLGYGLVKTESAFDRNALSNVGARGLTQLMPDTARWLRPGTSNADLHNDIALNLDLGFGYLRSLIDKYQGNTRLALLAYNRGPGTVDRVLSQGANPDNGYADLVLSGFRDLS